MMSKRRKKRNKTSMLKAIGGLILFFIIVSIIFGGEDDEAKSKPKDTKVESVETTAKSNDSINKVETETKEDPESKPKDNSTTIHPTDTIDFNGSTYKVIVVDGGDKSGGRQPNVAVDIGFGDREYWAFTNEYGQLINVIASKITLQDDATEPVTSKGRYYNDEAKVPGVERDDLDEGHIIADSLGGVSNAYNITPQDSTMNRHGDQAYMEKVIRDAGGCENFIATITYPDTTTQIPSHYHYEYLLNGQPVADDFDNVNPDEANAEINQQENQPPSDANAESNPTAQSNDISSVDTNGDGQVTIKEAKAAGYSMPIYSDSWLYPYMDDRDGDGMVGE
ncbi:MAG: DNA/RNA non-specific endonuclease [Bacteroidaceae bacterium]